MNLHHNVLSQDLLDSIYKELEYKTKEQCWFNNWYDWPKHLKDGYPGVTLQNYLSDDNHNRMISEIQHLFPKVHYTQVTSQFYMWNRGSGIPRHEDPHYSFTATLYLNNWDPDFGGWFIWKDEETSKTGVYKAVYPIANSLMVSDRFEDHWVTQVTPNAPNPRVTIQLWGEHENTQNISRE